MGGLPRTVHECFRIAIYHLITNLLAFKALGDASLLFISNC